MTRTVASAVIVERHAAHGCSPHRYGYALTDGPHAGITFVADPDDRIWPRRVGETVRVAYHADDQFAREVL